MPASNITSVADNTRDRSSQYAVFGLLRGRAVMRNHLVETGCDRTQESTVAKRRCWFKVLAQVLTVAFPLIAASGALAQETPRLVASNIPDIRGWCGDRAVYFQRPALDSDLTLTLLNIDSGKEKPLQLGKRWALARPMVVGYSQTKAPTGDMMARPISTSASRRSRLSCLK
jgi:hypothetical protein